MQLPTSAIFIFFFFFFLIKVTFLSLRVDLNSDQVAIIEEKISKVNGEIAIKRYSKGKMLGKGGFAKVFEVKNLETNKAMAGKIIQKSSLNKNRARQKVRKEKYVSFN